MRLPEHEHVSYGMLGVSVIFDYTNIIRYYQETCDESEIDNIQLERT